MNHEDLIQQISEPIGKKTASLLAEAHISSIPDLITLCIDQRYEVAFRAAWILELVAFGHTEAFSNHIREFTDTYSSLKNQSSRRHYTKILMMLTKGKYKGEVVAGVDHEAIVETTFEWMIDPDTPVAVKVNCMDILYNLRSQGDWIGAELYAQIEFQLKTGSAALQSRGKKILKKLSNDKPGGRFY